MVARLLTRPIAGALVLLLVALVLIGVAFAAYHGSDQTPPSSCAAAAALLRRTQADADTARQSVAASGPSSPAAESALSALVADGSHLTSQIQNQQSSDLAYDERALPLTDAITQAGTDARGPRLESDLDQVTAAATAVTSYCGV
jgi:hypothetical protein